MKSSIEEQAFHEGEKETIRKVLELIESTKAKRQKEGFGKAYHFTIGVLNCFLVAFAFAMYPEHFWILYIIEGLYLFPSKLYLDYHAKPLRELLYHLDYCWQMSTLGIAVFALLGFGSLDAEKEDVVSASEGHSLRKHSFAAFVGVTGVLMGATALLPFVALCFHSVRTMSGVFIHLFPPLLCYTFLWKSDVIKTAWPHVFDLSYINDLQFFPEKEDGSIQYFFVPFSTGVGTVAGNTIIVYLMWFIPYTIWMLVWGLNLPRKDGNRKPVWDTVFHSTVRGGLVITFGKMIWGRSVAKSKEQIKYDHYEVKDFLAYMFAHAFMATAAIYIIAYPCFRSRKVYELALLLLTALCAHRGSLRYKFYITDMYGHALRKEFAPLIQEMKQE